MSVIPRYQQRREPKSATAREPRSGFWTARTPTCFIGVTLAALMVWSVLLVHQPQRDQHRGNHADHQQHRDRESERLSGEVVVPEGIEAEIVCSPRLCRSAPVDRHRDHAVWPWTGSFHFRCPAVTITGPVVAGNRSARLPRRGASRAPLRHRPPCPAFPRWHTPSSVLYIGLRRPRFIHGEVHRHFADSRGHPQR